MIVWTIAGIWIGWDGGSPARAAVIADFDAGRHSRFLADGSVNPGFLIDHGLLSGIGVGSRAALITPRHFVTAAHAGDTTSVTFRGGDGTFRTYSAAASSYVDLTTHFVNEGISIAATGDVRLYTLDEAIPLEHGVTPVPILDADPQDLIGETFFVIGQGNRAGRNVVDDVGVVTFNDASRPTFNIQYSFDTYANGGQGGLGADEAGLIGGDSGFQAVLPIGDQLAVIGTHFGIDISEGQVPANQDRYDSFSTLLAPYLDQIHSITLADGYSVTTLSVTAVPEPRLPMLLTMIGLIAACRWRRRPLAAAGETPVQACGRTTPQQQPGSPPWRRN